MAGRNISFVTTSTSVTAAAAVYLQINAATNVGLDFEEWKISGRGIVNTALPILYHLHRATVDGVGGVALTPQDLDDDRSGTIQAAGFSTFATTDPTLGVILDRDFIHPQGGVVWQATFKTSIHIKAGGSIALQLDNTGGSAVNMVISCKLVE